ncbi:PKD domain-containing protein [Methanosarcina siciliae]|nr:PKD domain-containing protein [Methanosarcina siciliae]
MKRIFLILCIAALMCMTALASAAEETVEPVANFTANTTNGPVPLTVQFIDISTNATSRAWDFEDDGMVDSTESNPLYTYSKAGTYSVNLTVTNAAGSGSKVKTDYITVEETGTYGLADTAWPKFQRDLNNTGKSPYNGPQTNNTVWIYTTGGQIKGAPAIGSDGTIYIGNYGDKKVYALNSNGTIRWTYTTGGTNGISSTPAIGSDGTIYIGSGNYGLYALNSDGTLKWKYKTGGGRIRSSTAVGPDGTIYLGNYDDYKVYALNSDGTLKWTYKTGKQIESAPGIGSDGTIYIGSRDNKLYALNADGTLKWKYTTGGMIYNSPAIGSDGTIYIGSRDNKLYALNADGTLKWTYTTGGMIYGSPAIGSNGTIYIGSRDNKLYALNADGTLKWTYTTGGMIYGSPAVGSDGTLYIGSYDKNLYALNSDGTLKWTYKTGGSIYGSPAIGSDGTLYIGSYDNKLYAFHDATAPVASFTAFSTSGDAPLTVQFTDTSANYPTSWAWDFDNDGMTDSTEQNPSHTYVTPGTYTINLTVTNDAGEDSEISTDYITVTAPAVPVARFSANVTLGDVPLAVAFTDESTGNATSWAWDFDNDGMTDSTEQNPSHTYVTPGTYTVNLTVANGAGSDDETKTDYITVVLPPLPEADFSINATYGDAPLTVAFSDASTNSPTSWTWDFDNDGTIDATTQNLAYTYEQAGTYTVNLTASNAAGSDSEVKTDLITVTGKVDLTTTASLATTYPIYNNTMQATILNEGAENAGAFNLTFRVNGINKTVNVAGLDAGNNTTISITDIRRHAGDIVSMTVTVDPENTITEINETNNEYSTTETISTTGQKYNGGRYSNGYDLVNNVFYTEGNVGVAVAISGSYVSTNKKIVTTRTFSADDLDIPAGATIKSARLYQGSTWYGDPGFNLQFNGHETQEADAKYWDCINGQYAFDVTTYLNTTGDNTAVLTSTNSLNDYAYYATALIVVYEADSEPYRQIWVNEGSDCLLADYGADLAWGYTTFDNVSANDLFSARTITVLESDDGDVNSINFNGESLPTIQTGGSDPTIKYFNVTEALQSGENELGVTGPSYFNLANAVLEVTQVTASEANFTANVTSGNAPLNVKFTDTSTGTPANWTWEFGDGETSTEQNPTHTYTAEGTYTVKLTVSNSLGSDSEEKTGYITVGSVVLAPEANFSADPTTGTAPLSVQFTDESTNTPTSWTWDFGEGDTSTEQNPTHTYETIGTYTVKLTATNYGGSNSTIKTDYITVTSDVSAPIASFTMDSNSGRVPFTVKFTDTSNGSVSSWKWDFGDGGTATEQNPTHTYVTEGSYNITLTATGPGGSNTITSTEPVVVSAPLTSDSYNGGIPLTNVQNGTVSGELWYDSYYAMETSAQKAFTLPSYTDIKWARLYVDVYCGHMQNNYRGNVNIDIDANGDSTYELKKNETFDTTYSFPGEGGTGPVWLSDHMNRVTSDYLMWYDLTDVISGQTVNVQAITSKIDSSFDGRVKTMTLVVAYDDGDSDEVYYWVNQGHDTVNPLDDVYTGSTAFGTSTLGNGWNSANLSAIYLASVDGIYAFQSTTLTSGTPQGSYYGDNTWDVSSMLTAGEDSTFTYNKQDEKYYKIPLALMSVKYAGSGPVAPAADFSVNVTEGEVPLTVQFTDESTGSPTTWEWEFGDNETSSEQNPVHTYSAAGNYTVNLTITNEAGSDSEVKTDYIVITDVSVSLPWQDDCDSINEWTCTNCGLIDTKVYEGDYSIGCDAASKDAAAERTITIPSGAKTLRFNAAGVTTAYAYSESVKVYLDGSAKCSIPIATGGVVNWNRYEIDVSEFEPGEYTFKIVADWNTADWDNIGFYIDNIWIIADEEILNVINLTPSEAELSVGENITFSADAYTQYCEHLTDTTFAWSSSNEAVGNISGAGLFTALSEGTTNVSASAEGISGSVQVIVTGGGSGGDEKPVANFTADATSGTVPLTVNFTDQSTGSPTSWFWDFGDGANSTEQNPVHTYSAAGNYTVNLTASNAGGSDDELKTDYITVLEASTPEPEPVAAFTADVTNGDAPITVNFTDQSTGSPTSWSWDFGDGTNSTEQNPVHTYASAGSYTVNLTVENAAGTDFELKIDYIEVSEDSGSTVTLYFDPESASVAENESAEINLVASNFPAGLSGYNLTVTLDDPTVAEIVDIEYPSWALITENSTLPGASIYMKTVDLEDAVQEGAADVMLATLTVSGKEKGSANLSIGVKRLEEDSGDSIEPGFLTGTIEVTILSPLPDQEYAPKDLNGDGLYEDLTGNGEFSFVDIVAYFHNMDWIEENMPVEYFDFNGNGRIDFDDVVRMFAMI